MQTSALAAIRSGEFGPELTTAVGRTLPSLPPGEQFQVLSVLYDRGDRTAASIARAALAAGDPTVQAAAANLLSLVGDASDAPDLLRLMVGPEEPAAAARLALTRIPGEETTALLLTAFRGGGPAREAALEVLVGRGHRALIAELLQPGIYTDATLGPLAAHAILALGTERDLPPVLALHRQLPPDQRGPIESTLRRLAAKDPSPDEAAKLVFAAAEKFSLTEGAPLFVIVAGIGGDVAFASLTGVLKAPSVETRKVAVRALGNWRDVRPAPTLLGVAHDDADAAVRALAVQSATSLYGKSAFEGGNAPLAARVPAAIAGLRKTWDLAEKPAAKNAILAALRSLKDPKAIAAAEALEKGATRPK